MIYGINRAFDDLAVSYNEPASFPSYIFKRLRGVWEMMRCVVP